MDKDLIKNKIKVLRDELDFHNKLYYDENKNIISDYEYDIKMKELITLEETYPEFKNKTSPSVKVGGKITKEFNSFKHEEKMLSLSNTYSDDDLNDFDKRVKKIIDKNEVEYVCELKYDGVALSIQYENNIFRRALTRGDGNYGDDISNNVLTIKTLPIKLKNNELSNLEVRGEAFISKSNFKLLNKEKKLRGEQLFSNPRNTASGSLKLQDSSEVSKRKINCYIYSLKINSSVISTHEKCLEYLKSIGFNVPETYRKCTNIEEVKNYIKYWESRRYNLDVETDGIVIKVNDLKYQKILGNTSKSPRWAIAYKYKAESKVTQVRDIIFQVGRTGAVTPVAVLDPISIGGSIVKRASLHNHNEIMRLDVRLNDYVNIEKGGEIIPKITSVIKEKRDKNSKKFLFTTSCPSCGSTLEITDNQAVSYCKNYNDCKPQVSGRIEHFISKNAMDIDKLGPETIKGFIDNNIIKVPSDLYNIEFNDIINLEFKLEDKGKVRSLKEKSCNNILTSIEKSKSKPFSNLLFGLGIRFVGKTTAEKLSNHFKSIDNIINASYDEIIEIDEIGEKIAESVTIFFSDETNITHIQNLKVAGLKLEEETTKNVSNKLKDLIFVISGKFLNFSRDEIQNKIKLNGGKISKSLSSKTDFLISGENMGPKKKIKAKEIGTKIISEDDFISMI
ncbi:MAG: NAD-dependent DNA ligase LigA [Bacteroidota bacterium]|nr:NAD-dependent DNA ligase LigA [Bacteroidota bacterium]